MGVHTSGRPLIPRSEQDDGTTCPDRHVCRMFAEGKVMLARSEEHGYYLVTC
jgi:hypothetical protein